MSTIIIPELNVPFTFRKRPIAIPADLRPSWRVGLVLLILRKCCREGRASFARLHVLNWAARTPENQQALLDVVNKQIKPDTLVVRIEPALNRAVDLGSGEGLFQRVGGDRVELTLQGARVADELEQDQTLFQRERVYLSSLGRKVTESLVDRLFSSFKGEV